MKRRNSSTEDGRQKQVILRVPEWDSHSQVPDVCWASELLGSVSFRVGCRQSDFYITHETLHST